MQQKKKGPTLQELTVLILTKGTSFDSLRRKWNQLFLLADIRRIQNGQGNEVSYFIPDCDILDLVHLHQGCQTHFHWGHISLTVAFKGPNVILGLYKCNYSLTVKQELGTATGQKEGARLDKTRWRAGFGPRALCLPPLIYIMPHQFRDRHIIVKSSVKSLLGKTDPEGKEICCISRRWVRKWAIISIALKI